MIALSGGGTGGHLAIIKALKNALNQKGIKPVYIGSSRGQDRTWFESEEGFSQKFFLNSQGVVDKKGLKKLSALTEILKSSSTCRAIFKEKNIKSLISVGGYSAAPASFATIGSRVNLYIHEQNAAIGKLNKILKPFAKEFFSSYTPDSKVRDYPVDISFFKNKKEINELGTIIFLGGSQGSKTINALAINLAKELKKKNIHIIHQTGKNNFKAIEDFYKSNDIDADIFDFSPNLLEKISQADFAISRSGASTLWELCAQGIPTLFIPYPYAASDHQYYNAKTLSDKKLALLKRENEIDAKSILNEIKKLNLRKISKKLKEEISPNGAMKIIESIIC
ncbi:MAG: UDP-N-acetylglucosamine--N-acetylmuramyl-(pentapeptide) pyrophosphoryl-undecaprenol N-acetylglucosamine transferase [Sulfurospirillum sp.]